MSRRHTTPFIPRQCLVCGTHYSVPSSVAFTRHGQICGWACWFHSRREQILNFWPRVKKTETCWLWTGSTGRGGYGTFRDFDGKDIAAHRFSLEWHTGEVPGALLVCHSCDNRLCVRPEHLFLGTHAENSQDMVRKRRNHLPQRKLTFEIAQEIRSLYALGDLSQDQLAERFGVSQSNVSNILLKRCYSEANYL